jgi:hypothetical protein
MYLEKISLDLEVEKKVGDANGMLRIISAITLDKDEELCACFIDCQKVFDRVKWTILIENLKETGIDWH